MGPQTKGIIWQCVFMGILVLITGYYAIQVHNTVKLMEKDLEARNRPYLKIETPFIRIFDENYTKIEGHRYSSEVKFFDMPINLLNFGDIPAQLIEGEFEIVELNMTNTQRFNVTVYDKKYMEQTEKFEVPEGVLKFFKELNYKLTLKIKIKYKIYGIDNIFEAYNEAECKPYKIGIDFQVKCNNLISYTS